MKLIDLPWEPVDTFEHGVVQEKFAVIKEDVQLAARVVHHYKLGVSWFVYASTGSVSRRGTADSVSEARRKVDEGVIEEVEPMRVA